MIKKNDGYKEKLEREKNWYKPGNKESLSHKILYHPIFYSFDRVVWNYIFPKQQLSELANQLNHGEIGLILNAPCGRGDDFKYFKTLRSCSIEKFKLIQEKYQKYGPEAERYSGYLDALTLQKIRLETAKEILSCN